MVASCTAGLYAVQLSASTHVFKDFQCLKHLTTRKDPKIRMSHKLIKFLFRQAAFKVYKNVLARNNFIFVEILSVFIG